VHPQKKMSGWRIRLFLPRLPSFSAWLLDCLYVLSLWFPFSDTVPLIA
jgi:hypothetical protein